MNIAARAIRDTQRFTADANGFGISIDLIAPTSETITVIGYTTKHHLKYDADTGAQISSKVASVAISEGVLDGYPVRDANSNVSMLDHRVTFLDSDGNTNNFIVVDSYPDEKVGLIILILGDYE